MVENSSMGKKEVEKPWTLAQLESVPALVGEQGAHVDREVLLVGKRREQGEGEAVVVRLVVDVRRQAIVGSQIFCEK